MKTLLLFFGALIFSVPSFAQTMQWSSVITEGGQGDEFGNVCRSDHLGNTYASWSGDGRIMVAKYNSQGNTIWVDSFAGATYSTANSILFDKAGNVIVAGEYRYRLQLGAISFPYANSIRSYVAKLNAIDGTVAWARNYIGQRESDGMAIDDAGNIYLNNTLILVDTLGTDTLRANGRSDILLLKINSNDGDVIWKKQMGSYGDEYGYSIAVSGSELYLTGVYCNDSIQFDQLIITNPRSLDTSGNMDVGEIWLAKFDTGGHVQWAKSMGGKQLDMAMQLATDRFHHVYIAGFFTDSAYFDNVLITNPRHVETPFVASYHSNGQLNWVRGLTGKSGYGDNTNSLTTDSSGNVHATGSAGDSTYVGTTLFPKRGMFVVKWDSSGNQVWAQSVLGQSGWGICQTHNGSDVFVIGNFMRTQTFGALNVTSAGGVDMFLARLSATTGLPFLQEREDEITVYPNPAKSSITIKYPPGNYTEISITDITGRAVYTGPVNGQVQEMNVDLPTLANGFYSLTLKGSGLSKAKKLIIQR